MIRSVFRVLVGLSIGFLTVQPFVGQQLQRTDRNRQRVPASVTLIGDIPYAGTDNSRQTLDLAIPAKKQSEPLPVVVFIHGGAWRSGHKNTSLSRVLDYVASGHYAGVTVGYRLSDEVKWPSQIHDCKAAIRWIRKNAQTYGLDADRIGVWGSSAGGHLVALLGTSGDVKAMDGTLGPFSDVSGRVACVVDFYGPTDFLQMNNTAIEGASMDHDAPDSPESSLIGGPIQENAERVATANPITYATSDDPPFLIVHGTRDPLVSYNQSELLHHALTSVGVRSTLVTVEGGGHGKGFGRDVSEAVSRFLAHHLRGQKSAWQDQRVRAVDDLRSLGVARPYQEEWQAQPHADGLCALTVP